MYWVAADAGVNKDAGVFSSVTNTQCAPAHTQNSCGCYGEESKFFWFLLRQMRAQKFTLKICIENVMTISLSAFLLEQKVRNAVVSAETGMRLMLCTENTLYDHTAAKQKRCIERERETEKR